MPLSYLDFTTELFHYISSIFLQTRHMNESISDVIKIVLGFLGGYFGHVLKAKYENRIINFKQRVNGFVVGNSIESEDWGDISILYRGNRANNLYSVTIEIFNESNFGYSDLELEIAFPQGCVIYQCQALYVVDDTKHKKILQKDQFFKYYNDIADRWSQEFQKNSNAIPRNLQQEMNSVSRMRIFTIPVFRRQSNAIFHFLVDNIERILPKPIVDIPHDRIKITSYVELDKRKRDVILWSTIIGTLIYGISIYIVLKYCNSIKSAVWALNISGIVSIVLGWLIYVSGRWIKKYVLE